MEQPLCKTLSTSRPWGHGDPSPVPSFHLGSGPALHPGFTMELDLLSLCENNVSRDTNFGVHMPTGPRVTHPPWG